jgi:hypothetical protein
MPILDLCYKQKSQAWCISSFHINERRSGILSLKDFLVELLNKHLNVSDQLSLYCKQERTEALKAGGERCYASFAPL